MSERSPRCGQLWIVLLGAATAATIIGLGIAAVVAWT
jgi:hypothetical protein